MRKDIELGRVALSCLFFGMVFGLIGAVPIIWAPNICFIEVFLAGALASFASGWGKRPMEPGDGIIIGALLGLSYSIFNEISYHLFSDLFFSAGLILERPVNASGGFLFFILAEAFYFLFNLAGSVFFGALGGLSYVRLASINRARLAQKQP